MKEFDFISQNSRKNEMIGFMTTLSLRELIEITRSINSFIKNTYPYKLKTSGTKEELISQIRSCKQITPKIIWDATEGILEDFDEDEEDDWDDDIINPNSTKQYLLEWLSDVRKENIIYVLNIINQSRKNKLSVVGKKKDLLKRFDSVPRKALWIAIEKMVDELSEDDD